jgi:hypothetical protein
LDLKLAMSAINSHRYRPDGERGRDPACQFAERFKVVRGIVFYRMRGGARTWMVLPLPARRVRGFRQAFVHTSNLHRI